MDNYNAKYVGPPSGFNNFTGAACWFNAMLQGFISCSSFNRVYTENRDAVEKNDLSRAVSALVKTTIAGGDITTMNAKVFDEFIKILRATDKGKTKIAGAEYKFGSGQEDASEGFELFIDALGAPPALQNLFEQRYLSTIQCMNCRRVCSETKIAMHMIDISAKELVDSELTMKYILEQAPPIDGEFVCKICGTKGEKMQTRKLVCAPEVFVIQFKKYEGKWEAKCPDILKIPMRDGVSQEYKMVSLTEHAGGQTGGHYWAHALRGDGKVYRLDDSTVGNSSFNPSGNTYLIWYHAFK